MRDLDFVSGRFFDYEIPAEKRYLTKYFRTPMQQAFVRYHLIFNSVKNFVDHTGHHCNRRFLFRMQAKLKRLVTLHDEAKRSLTEEGMRIVDLIESGEFSLTGKKKC